MNCAEKTIFFNLYTTKSLKITYLKQTLMSYIRDMYE